MRATVYLSLLAGLLAGLAEGYSVPAILPGPATEEELQLVAGRGAGSKESLENDIDKDIVLSGENDIDSRERYDRSFIASEETEEGKLWISDDDPDWTPSETPGNDDQDDYTLEDDDYNDLDYVYSEEEDDFLENKSQLNDDNQEVPRPLPEVLPTEQGVNAEYSNTQGNGDFGSPSPQDTQEGFTQGPFPVKRKRNVKTSYQVVQVPTAYGSEQDAANSGSRGNIQEGDGGNTQVSTGVEPLKPVEGPNQQEVGAGVEPETGGKDFGGSATGGWLQQGWRRFTGAVEDLGDQAQDTFRNLGDKITEKYNDLREKLPQLVQRFKALILKFGLVIQEGARYCLRRFEHAADKVRESQVIVKLEQELKAGHAEVAKFFQILGEKVQAWREQHGSANIDAGLTGGNTQEGQNQLEEGPQRQDIEQGMPDFFQDDQVLVQLNKLTEAGVLTQDDVIILTQQHQNQQSQQQGQQSQQQGQQSQQQGQQSQQQGQQSQQESQQQSQQSQSQNSDFQQNQQDQNSDIQQQNQNSNIQQQNQNSDLQQQDQNSDLQQQNQQDQTSDLQQQNQQDQTSDLQQQNQQDQTSDLQQQNQQDQTSDLQQQNQQDQTSDLQQQNQQQNYYQQPSKNYNPKFIQFPE